MDLRAFQARWTLDLIPPERVHEVATVLLAAGVESPALIELAGRFDAPSRADLAPVVERVFREAALSPLTREAALWRSAYAAAEAIITGEVAPVDGAAALWSIDVELEMPDALNPFVYYAADYGEGPGDRATEEAWFDAQIRETARDLLARRPPDGESPPRAAV